MTLENLRRSPDYQLVKEGAQQLVTHVMLSGCRSSEKTGLMAYKSGGEDEPDTFKVDIVRKQRNVIPKYSVTNIRRPLYLIN